MMRWLCALFRSRPPAHTLHSKEPADPVPVPQSSTTAAADDSPCNTIHIERTEIMMDNSQNVQMENMILNGDFSEGLRFWHPNCCHAYVASDPNSGRSYAVVTGRTECWQGLEQDIKGRVVVGVDYTVSAFVRVGGDLLDSAEVQATVRVEHSDSTSTNYISLGRISGSKECWMKLEGTFSLESTGERVILYLEGPPPGVDLHIDSVTISSNAKQFEEPADPVPVPQSSSTAAADDSPCNTIGIERTAITMDNSQNVQMENMILNGDFSEGLRFWHPNCCHAYVASDGVTSNSGRSYAVVTGRTECWQGLEQDIKGRVVVGVDYTVSAFVRVGGDLLDSAEVQATVRVEHSDSTSTNYISLGRISGSKECWMKLEGTFSLESTGERVILYLEGPPPGVDLHIDSVTISSSSKQFEGTDVLVKSPNVHPKNIILNGDFSDGLHFWHPNSCHAYVASEETGFPNGVKANSGRSYAIVTNRTESWQGLEQDITDRVVVGTAYTVLAFVRVCGDLLGSSEVQATLKVDHSDSSSTSYLSLGRISVLKECWKKLDGSFSLASKPKRVIFFLEGPSPGVDLLIDYVIISSSISNAF